MATIIKGYKILKNNLKANDYQYTIGLNKFNESIKMCQTGFHFCIEAIYCLQYYQLYENHRYFEVSAIDDIDTNLIVVTNGNKSVTNNLTLKKELSFEEFRKLCTDDFISAIKSCNNIEDIRS